MWSTFPTGEGIWASQLMGRETVIRWLWKWKRWPVLIGKKDASHLQAEFITSAVMILPGSFKLETRRKVNENESRYNPKTPQTSSAGRQLYISFKGALCGKEEGLQWQTYYLSLFKVRAGGSIGNQNWKRGHFYTSLGFYHIWNRYRWSVSLWMMRSHSRYSKR